MYVHTLLFVYDVSRVCLQLALHMCAVSRVLTVGHVRCTMHSNMCAELDVTHV
jgi:hypothetical protein